MTVDMVTADDARNAIIATLTDHGLIGHVREIVIPSDDPRLNAYNARVQLDASASWATSRAVGAVLSAHLPEPFRLNFTDAGIRRCGVWFGPVESPEFGPFTFVHSA